MVNKTIKMSSSLSPSASTNKTQKKITKSEFFQDDDNNAKLIRFVYERPALYNYKLPVKERSHIYKNELWEEVAFSLGVSVTECKNRWKNLRDTFQLYRHKHMSDKTLTKWKFSELLSFLENLHTYRPRRSTSNCNTNTNNLKSYEQKVLVSIPGISENPLHEISIQNNPIEPDQESSCLIEEYQNDEQHSNSIDYNDITMEKELYKIDYCESSDPIVEEIHQKYIEIDDHDQHQHNNKSNHNHHQWSNNKIIHSILGKRKLSNSNSSSTTLLQSSSKLDKCLTSTEEIDNNNKSIQHNHTDKSDMDELDFLMEFLKKKIRRLKPDDISNIEMKFIEIVFQKEKELRNIENN